MSTLKVNNIAGVSGGTSPPITLSGDTATLGSDVTNNAGVASGTIASGVTIASGINMPDFDWNLSSGENRIITFGSKGFALYGVVDATGTGNSSARTGVYGNSSSSGSFKVIYMNGQIGKTGTRGDIGHFKFQTNTLYVVSRVQGYFMGPSSNAVGEGTLSPVSYTHLTLPTTPYV